jgi:hypothetical protein
MMNVTSWRLYRNSTVLSAGARQFTGVIVPSAFVRLYATVPPSAFMPP